MTIDARWAIAFEGVGVVGKSLATAWGYGEEPPTPGDREWRDSLASEPQSVDSSVTPSTGEFALSSFTFEVHSNDPEAETFLYQQTRPRAVLTADLSASATTIEINDESLAGSIVYLGMETIQLATHLGAGSYTCVRGHHASTATPHDAGRNVYTRIPRWRGRGVEMISYSDDGVGVPRWRGVVEGISTSEDGTRILIPCRELWSTLLGSKVNRGAEAIQDHDLIVEYSYRLSGTLTTGPTSRKRSQFTFDSAGERLHFFQVADSLCLFSLVGPSLWRADFDRLLESGREEFAAELAVESDGGATFAPLQAPVYELFVVSKALDRFLSGIGYSTATPASVTRDYAYPYHPLTIAAVLLFGSERESGDFSRYDTATTRWSVNIGSLFAADILTTLTALIEATREIEVDFFMLGWDGEEVDVLKTIITRLLRPYGFFLGVTTDGRLTFSRFDLFDVVRYDVALGNRLAALTSPLQIGYDSAQGSAVDVIEARVGERPWRSGRNILLQAQGGDTDRARLGDGARHIIDYSTIDEGNIDAAISRIVSASMLGVFAMPRITVRVDDADVLGTSLDHGDLAVLEDLPIEESYLVDRNGVRVSSIDDRPEFAGIVIGRRFLVGPRTYEITLLFTNFRGGLARFRTPSMVVEGKDGSAVECVSDSLFGALGSDAEEFNDGDEVVFYDGETMEQIDSTIYTVVSIAPGSVTLSPPPSSLVVVGSIMELADYSDYENRPFVTNSTLIAYVYMAVGGELGDGDEAHTYGV